MEIRIEDIEPNPFRQIEHYPIDRNKVEALKNSINETDFWNNILVREHPEKEGKYQLAYGHHRLAALKELNWEVINIQVHNIDDDRMIKIMANENFEDWRSSPLITIETVSAARLYIDSLFAQAESFDALHENMKGLTDAEHFQQLKNDGVGEKTILKFLGGHWKQYMIQGAREILDDDRVDRDAVNMIPNMVQAKALHILIKSHPDITKEEQLEIAQKIRDDDIPAKSIPMLVPERLRVVRTEDQQLLAVSRSVARKGKDLTDTITDCLQRLTASESDDKYEKIITAVEELRELSRTVESFVAHKEVAEAVKNHKKQERAAEARRQAEAKKKEQEKLKKQQGRQKAQREKERKRQEAKEEKEIALEVKRRLKEEEKRLRAELLAQKKTVKKTVRKKTRKKPEKSRVLQYS